MSRRSSNQQTRRQILSPHQGVPKELVDLLAQHPRFRAATPAITDERDPQPEAPVLKAPACHAALRGSANRTLAQVDEGGAGACDLSSAPAARQRSSPDRSRHPDSPFAARRAGSLGRWLGPVRPGGHGLGARFSRQRASPGLARFLACADSPGGPQAGNHCQSKARVAGGPSCLISGRGCANRCACHPI